MDGVLVRITGGRLKICIGGITASDTLSDAFVSCWVSDDGLQWFKYSGLTLNQDKADEAAQYRQYSKARQRRTGLKLSHYKNTDAVMSGWAAWRQDGRASESRMVFSDDLAL
ncbi:hypothetical protein HMPREF2726_04645 [Neisseria sp. HMSC074B07]|nr:hypothetical protein HMPREF2726_04645 [Neisseria sp. HMSC074B07]